MTHKTLSRYMHNGLQITAVDRPQCREYYITGQEHAASDFRELLGLLAKTLDDLDAALVSIEVFGVDGNCRSLLEEVLQG